MATMSTLQTPTSKISSTRPVSPSSKNHAPIWAWEAVFPSLRCWETCIPTVCYWSPEWGELTPMLMALTKIQTSSSLSRSSCLSSTFFTTGNETIILFIIIQIFYSSFSSLSSYIVCLSILSFFSIFSFSNMFKGRVSLI